MKVVHVSFSYDESAKSEEQLLEKHYTVTGWAEALQKKGVEVIVVNRFFRDGSINVNGVLYYFVKDRYGAVLRGWQIPVRLFKKIKELNPDLIHLHHLTLCLQTFVLRSMFGKKIAMVVQHHGGIMKR